MQISKCKNTVDGLDPRIASTTHSSKRHIFSFPFDLVVILPTLNHKLCIQGYVT